MMKKRLKNKCSPFLEGEIGEIARRESNQLLQCNEIRKLGQTSREHDLKTKETCLNRNMKLGKALAECD